VPSTAFSLAKPFQCAAYFRDTILEARAIGEAIFPTPWTRVGVLRGSNCGMYLMDILGPRP
jgi:hypothetical protein